MVSLPFTVLIKRVPPRLMLVIVAVFRGIGAFAIRNNMKDVYVMAALGLLDWVFHLLNLPARPLAFGLILGPILQENVRRSLMIS